MTRTILIIAILTAALAAPLLADDAAAAQFFIERIEVRNAKRVSSDVVIAESRLREGQKYSEDALRDAATRLSRLPFLLSVDFALEKGSERGRHVLVLTIKETKPFFYLLDGVKYFSDEALLELDHSDRLSERGNALGFRWFVGRRSAVHVGFVGGRDDVRHDYESIALGYTQYDLFGTRAFATLNLKRPIEGPGGGRISSQVVVGIPLSANQTLTLEFDETRFERSRPFDGAWTRLDYGQREVSARWSYNTTNVPFFPTRGTLLHVEPFVTWTDVGEFMQGIEPRVDIWYPTHHSRVRGVHAGASRYWEITDRDSVSGDIEGWWMLHEIRVSDVQSVDESESRVGSISAGISHSLWDRSRRANGDSRLELKFRFANRTTLGDAFVQEINVYSGRDVRQVAASWVRRSSWGTLRLGGGWAW